MIKGFHIPYSFGEDEIKRFGERLIDTGHFEWIEIKWPLNLFDFDPSSYIRGIRYLTDSFKLGVSCHIPTNLDLGQTNTRMRATLMKEIRECIDYAATFGASILPLHPGTILTMDIPATDETETKQMLRLAGERKRETARAMTVEIAQELADYARQYNMTIAMENLLLPQENAHTALDLRDMILRCKRDNVRALFDCGHAHRVGADQGDFIRTLGNLVCHVHLNDNDGTCDLHQQIGEGTIDFDAVFVALREIGYQGALVMETSYRDSDDLLESSRLLNHYLKAGE